MMQETEEPADHRLETTVEKKNAPKIDAKQLRKSLNSRKLKAQKKKQQAKKTTLLDPYEEATWPDVPRTEQTNILQTLKRHFIDLRLDQHYAVDGKTKNERITERNSFNQKHPDIIELRCQFVCGMNEVMKHLERDNLRCVMICRSSPVQLTKMLIPLLATRGCPAVCMHDFSAIFGELLRRKCLTTLGIKKRGENENAGLDSIVDYVNEVSKPIEFMGLSNAASSIDEETLEENCDEESDDDSEVDEIVSCHGDESSAGGTDFNDLYVMRKDWKTDFKTNADFIKIDTTDSDSDMSDRETKTKFEAENKPLVMDGILGFASKSESDSKSGIKRKPVKKKFVSDNSRQKPDYKAAKIQKMAPRPDKTRKPKEEKKSLK
ncbi:uncharacterized protein LOC141910791 isoform X2 [Tubulanus polymorphus]